MSNCKHENVVFTEIGRSYNTHIFTAGKYECSNHGLGELTGQCRISCTDCGLEKEFNRFKENLPQWIRAYIMKVNQAYQPEGKQ